MYPVSLKGMETSLTSIKSYAKMMPEIKPGDTGLDPEEKGYELAADFY